MLTVKNLTKVFGGFTAVSSVDFSVEKGEIVFLTRLFEEKEFNQMIYVIDSELKK